MAFGGIENSFLGSVGMKGASACSKTLGQGVSPVAAVTPQDGFYFPPQSTAASPREWLLATTPSSSPPPAWTAASSSTACNGVGAGGLAAVLGLGEGILGWGGGQVVYRFFVAFCAFSF